MSLTTHSNSTTEIANVASQDNFFDTSSSGEGFTLSNATLKLVSRNHNLHLDGRTIVSDGNLSIATTASNTEIIFGTASTAALKIDGTGRLDILSAKLLINGDNGNSGQVLTTDGLGNISWTTPATAQHAFANISVTGQTTIQASSTSETIEFEAGSGISITTNTSSNPKKVTIANSNTAANAFSTFAVSANGGSASGSNAVADSETDTLTLVAGSNITLTADSNNDQITIASTGSGTGSQNLFRNISSANQTTISATSTTDTLAIESENDPSGIVTRDGNVEITTDSSQRKVTLKAKIPITHSHSGKMPVVTSGGSSTGIPLKNHFIPVTTTATVNGGGSTVAMSTRAVEVLKADGSTLDRLVMPPTTSGKTLVFTATKSDGSTTTKELDMGE